MLLCIDVGNTTTVIGVFEEDRLNFVGRVASDNRRTVDEYTLIVRALLDAQFGRGLGVQRAVISSVVPPLTPVFTELAEKLFGVSALVVGPGVKTGLTLKVREPSAVGADRVVNAVALKNLFGFPGVVVDFGTATSFDVVDEQGAYLGGAISPGIAGSLDSLVKAAAKLPKIEIVWPTSVIGRDTVSAMQVGTVVGYVAMVDGLLERMAAELGEFKYVVATGGLGDIVSRHSRMIQSYHPHLTLHGLRLIDYLQRDI